MSACLANVSGLRLANKAFLLGSWLDSCLNCTDNLAERPGTRSTSQALHPAMRTQLESRYDRLRLRTGCGLRLWLLLLLRCHLLELLWLLQRWLLWLLWLLRLLLRLLLLLLRLLRLRCGCRRRLRRCLKTLGCISLSSLCLVPWHSLLCAEPCCKAITNPALSHTSAISASAEAIEAFEARLAGNLQAQVLRLRREPQA